MQLQNNQTDLDIAEELRKGIAYHRSGQLAEARDIYNKVIKAYPVQPDALHLLGVLELEGGRLENAEEFIAKAIQSDPGQATFYNNLGNVFLQKECLDEAAQNYHKALALKPDYAAAYFNLGNVHQQLKQWREAITHYCRALAIKSDFVQAWFNLAKAYRAENHIKSARDAFHKVVRLKPDFVDAYDELASIYDDLSQPDKAIFYYKKSLELKPDCWTSCFNLGNIYRQNDNIEHAIWSYRRALELNPQSGEIYLNLGICHKAAGQLNEAEQCYQRCIDIQPGLAEVYYNLGNLYHETDRFEPAIQNYRRSLDINPEMIEVLNNLGEVCRRQGLFDDAVKCLDRSLKINSNNPDSLHNLGTVLIKIGRAQEAIGLFERVLEIKPDLSIALNGMGSAFLALDRIDEAYACYQRALKIDPVNPGTLFNLGVTCQSRGEDEQSKEYFEQVLKLSPELMPARWQYHLLLPVLYDNEEKISDYRKRFEKGLGYLINNTELHTPKQRKGALEGIRSRTNFYLSYQGKGDLALQKLFGNFAARIMATKYPHWARSRKMPLLTHGTKIRIGFVSAYMYFHTVGVYLKGWIEKINHQEFELFGYHISNKADGLTEKLRNDFDHYHQVFDNLELAAQQIVVDDLHVLVFPDIGMNPLSIMLGALRLAPVQCTSWGHPVTTGLPTMDYFLSSDLMEPENAQSHYSERLIRLPNIALFYQKPAIPLNPVVRKSFGLDEEAFVYLSPQSLFKYLPQYDDIFPRIAREVHNAQFIFISHPSGHVTGKFKKRLAAAFEKYQIDIQSCCLFLPRLSFDEYLSLNLVSNALLDTPAWSGGKTSIEGIGCGLPIVTIPGEFMRGRHSYAMLKMMDINETIAEDIDHYVDIAVRLGKDDQFYLEIKQKISSSCHRLFNDYSVPAALESFFKTTVKEFGKND